MIVKRFINNKAFSCSLYVVSIDKVNFIVDPGFCSKEILNYLDSVGGLDFILITHGHFDHILGLNQFVEVYKDVKIYSYYLEEEVLFSSKLNLTKSINCIVVDFSKNYLPLTEGKQEINGVNFEVIPTPGHTVGSCSYLFRKEKVIFVGDFIFFASVGRSDLPTGNEFELYNSISKFKKLNLDSALTIYPGHDKTFTLEQALKINPYLK